MPFAPTDMTNQTGSAYKAPIDANFAALAGIRGKRRNINGDGRVCQRPTASISGSAQYFADMWEVFANTPANVSGTFGQISDVTNLPAGTGVGCSSITTTGIVTVSMRTKIPAEHVADMLQAPYLYPVTGTPKHPFGSLGLIAYQTTGSTITVTPIIRSADAANNFSTMTNSITGAAQNLGSSAATQLWWETATNAFQLDNLTNFLNGICIELQFALPSGVSAKVLELTDVQFEGGQVATYYDRTPDDIEFIRCRRWYQSTFPRGTLPAQNAGTGSGPLCVTQVVAASTAQKGNFWKFDERLGKVPSTVTFYNPAAANAQARNLDSASDCTLTAVSAQGSGTNGVPYDFTTPGATSAGQRITVHITADPAL